MKQSGCQTGKQMHKQTYTRNARTKTADQNKQMHTTDQASAHTYVRACMHHIKYMHYGHYTH